MPVKSKKTAVVSQQCVACGCCVKVCPKEAVTIHRGISAAVDETKCVGCGRCEKACPASVIQILERGEEK